MAFSAPDITAVSKPNKKPPNATTRDQKKTLLFFTAEKNVERASAGENDLWKRVNFNYK
ncbi:hypothetical protein GCM10027346_40980 [Hymenobacter seoulensis]